MGREEEEEPRALTPAVRAHGFAESRYLSLFMRIISTEFLFRQGPTVEGSGNR